MPNPKKAPIGNCAHESGRSAPALERFAPVEAGGVERFAPGGGANRSSKRPAHDVTRECRARTGDGAHESGIENWGRE